MSVRSIIFRFTRKMKIHCITLYRLRTLEQKWKMEKKIKSKELAYEIMIRFLSVSLRDSIIASVKLNLENLEKSLKCLFNVFFYYSGLAYFVPLLNIIMWLGIRGKIREMKGIEGSTVNDCLTILCCPLCALVQEAQEVQGGPSAQSMCRE